MELATRGEFGLYMAFRDRDVLQAVIAKHAFQRPDDFSKDNPCRRLIGQFDSDLDVSLAGLDQLDAPGVLVLQIEDGGTIEFRSAPSTSHAGGHR